MAPPTPADFDEAFGNVIRPRILNAIMRTGFPDLPAWIDSYDFVSASGLAPIAAHLRAGPERILVPAFEGGGRNQR